LDRTIIIKVKPKVAMIETIPNAPGIRYKIEIKMPIPKIIKPNETTNPTIGFIPKTLELKGCSMVEVLLVIVLNRPVESAFGGGVYATLTTLSGNSKAKFFTPLRTCLAS
jgi:hypothetical protein